MPAISPFIVDHIPLLWSSLVGEFGTDAAYWPAGDDTVAVLVVLVWMEGAADEESSPGRYSSAFVKNDELPGPPALGDAVARNGSVFDVVRVDAYAYGCSRLVFQERGNGA